jgi:hypothetical protein
LRVGWFAHASSGKLTFELPWSSLPPKEVSAVTPPTANWLEDPERVAIARQVHEDLEWALAHYSELEPQYRGEYVAVWQKQVIAHAKELEQLLSQAASPEHPREQLAVVEFPDFLETPR